MSAVSRNWFVQTYKMLGAQPAKFYTLWVLFFTAVSALYEYSYYLLHPVTNFFLSWSALGFLCFFPLVFRSVPYPSFDSDDMGWQITGVMYLIFVPFFLSASYLDYQMRASIDAVGFYLYPIHFYVGWLLVGKILMPDMRQAAETEWWLRVSLEGMIPSERDIQVGNKNIDDYLQIFGEPRTWWEQRLQEPEGRSFLARCRSQGDVFAMTAQKISICAEAHKEQAEKWREALNNNPPTPQDWKDSGFDFSNSAQDKAAAASHPGSPIAVPSLIDRDDG